MINVFEKNATINFFMENGSFEDKRNIRMLTEADLSNVSNNLVSKLYKSAIDKSYVDFDDIPLSKGDITKYTGYTDMMQSLDILDNIARKSNVTIPEINTVLKAIGNITALRDKFTKGYALNNNFIMLQYCTLTATCVEATSGLIASFVDYVKTVDTVEFKIIQPSKQPGAVAIKNLESFNTSVASGEYVKVIDVILKNGNINGGIVKESAVVITAAVITSIVAVVVLMRQIVFRFFYMRMKVSDYLKMQAIFLEMNKENVKAKENKLSPEKRKKVLKKQEELAKKLMNMSDKLKVEYATSETKINKAMNDEHKTYSLGDLSTNNSFDNIELL
jgi:hypothetical protein